MPISLPLTRGAKVTLNIEGATWAPTHQALLNQLLTLKNGTRISVGELHRRSGVSRSTLDLILKGYRRPLLESGLKISRALDLSPWTFLSWWKAMRALPRTRWVMANAKRKHTSSAQEIYRRLIGGNADSGE